MNKKPPKCKCGNPCQWYGYRGGHSVSCVWCNRTNARRQRIARARKKKRITIHAMGGSDYSDELVAVCKDGFMESFELQMTRKFRDGNVVKANMEIWLEEADDFLEWLTEIRQIQIEKHGR